MAQLKESGIQTSIHYPPVHRFTAYEGKNGHLDRTTEIGDRELTLPLFPTMTDEDQRSVVAELLKSIEACKS